ncbi:PREDICTED: uncharacterized protein LOC104592097 isoform X1 [Nelumbo nucifera]|uniref:Uncharacterized protein LOC104592097 isoform X1 n=1 Tax=Nelumbo nucifera TaxID=4432 RepID=A0A1U7Z853_NELNU|nr:PREDICTED: uncharacterized protein LOC104592097 isoform X1 [Nelumbo nucifera]
MATEIKVHVLKAKPNQDGSSKVKGLSPLNKKKVVSSSKHTPDSKQKSVSTLTKSEVKAKTTSTTSSSSKSVSKTTAVKVKSKKKVYTLPGQKYDPPEVREPLRIFYESLSKQIPSSEMAEFWMMEHGLLSPERAKKAYERKQRRQQQLRMGTPIKSLKLDKPESSQKQKHASKNSDLKTKKRIINENDDDDFIVRPKKIVKS